MIMFSKKSRRAIAALALAAVSLTIPMMAGCSSKHPAAKMDIAFNGTTYTLKYKLYRNMYPQTVQHFIELADNNFYNNTIIHNYTDTYLYAGAYSYDKTEYEAKYSAGSSAFQEYFSDNSLEKAYYDLSDPTLGKITPSIYEDYVNGSYIGAYRTLIGEFKNNQHTIEKGALTGSFGALRMYYTAKNADNKHVVLKKDGTKGLIWGDYSLNCATSIFNIQVSSSMAEENNYCVFATLTNPEELTALRTAITKYIEDKELSTSSFRTSVTTSIDYYDDILYAKGEHAEVTYSVPQQPIVIKSVKITKY